MNARRRATQGTYENYKKGQAAKAAQKQLSKKLLEHCKQVEFVYLCWMSVIVFSCVCILLEVKFETKMIIGLLVSVPP